MKRIIVLLLLLCVVVPLGATVSSMGADCVPNDGNTNDDADGVKTMAGSCKNNAGDIKCGAGGNNLGAAKAYANTSANQTEVEGCNDTGAPNGQGRFVVRLNHNTANPGARVSLDSDKDQTPANICCSYINAHVGTTDPGVWCGEDGNPNGVPGDGYAHPWTDPGEDGGDGSEAEGGDAPVFLECVPTQ